MILQKLTEQTIPAKDSLVKKTTALLKVLDQVNNNHDANVKLVRKLNDRPKMKIRAVPPILFIGEKDGQYNVNEARFIIKDILKLMVLRSQTSPSPSQMEGWQRSGKGVEKE